MDPAEWQLRIAPEKGRRILILEDEIGVAEGLQMILEQEGYEVDLAFTGRNAMDTLRKKTVDLLVADLRLPDMDGMEVVRHVKATQPGTKVIVITGYPTVPSALDAMKRGASDYLPKPFREDDFKAAVEKAFRGRRVPWSEDMVAPGVSPEERLIQRLEVLKVLERTTPERIFRREPVENGSEDLRGCRLSREAMAAMDSGDLEWIRQPVRKQTRQQLVFIDERLKGRGKK